MSSIYNPFKMNVIRCKFAELHTCIHASNERMINLFSIVTDGSSHMLSFLPATTLSAAAYAAHATRICTVRAPDCWYR